MFLLFGAQALDELNMHSFACQRFADPSALAGDIDVSLAIDLKHFPNYCRPRPHTQWLFHQEKTTSSLHVFRKCYRGIPWPLQYGEHRSCSNDRENLDDSRNEPPQFSGNLGNGHRRRGAWLNQRTCRRTRYDQTDPRQLV
jgi:hypothetical protein